MKNYKLARRTLTVLLMTLMITGVFAIMPAMGCSCECGSIVLSPESAVNNIGTSHTVTATVLCCKCGCSIRGREVNFTVVSGPNEGENCTAYTDSYGNATFTYTGTTVGIDTIEATIYNTCSCGSCGSGCSCGTVYSNQVTKEWVDPNAVIPEFPTIAIPVLSIIGLMFIMSRRRD